MDIHLELDGTVVSAVRLNRSKNKTEDSLRHTLKYETSGIVAQCFNTNKSIILNKEGGTCIKVLNKLENIGAMVDYDSSGLGRWTSIKLQEKGVRIGGIVYTYTPCKTRNLVRGYSTVHAQHIIWTRFSNDYICTIMVVR